MIPGQGLIEAAVSGRIVIWIDAGQFKGLHPAVIVEHFRPAIEFTAQFPSFVEDLPHAAVAAGKGRFQAARLGVVVVVRNVLIANESLDVLLLAFDFLNGQLSEPLEGRVRFGYETRDGDRHLAVILMGHRPV